MIDTDLSNIDPKRSASPVSFPHTQRYRADTPNLTSEFELKEVDTISETDSAINKKKAKEEESIIRLMDDFSDLSAVENKRKISDETYDKVKGDLLSSSSPEGLAS